jgi:hypothetical protein
MTKTPKRPPVFISYAWEDDVSPWVKKLSKRLRKNGIDVRLDRWELQPGDYLPAFMETAVRESDFVILVCTPKYKQKSDERVGGVGFEGHVITAEIFGKSNHRKFIPVLRKGDVNSAMPSWASGKLFIDLRGESFNKDNYKELIRTLHGKNPGPPPIGIPPEFLDDESEESDEFYIEDDEDVTRQIIAKETADREAAEKVAREKAENEAAEKARLKAEEDERQRIAKEKAEREAAKKEAAEKARLKAEEDERQRIAKEKAEREAADKAAKENADREAAEKVAREKAEKDAREKTEKEAAEKDRLEAEEKEQQRIAKEKADKDAVEKATREKAKEEAANLAHLKAEEEEQKRIAEEKTEPETENSKSTIYSAISQIVIKFISLLPRNRNHQYPPLATLPKEWGIGLAVIFIIILISWWVVVFKITPVSPAMVVTPSETLTPSKTPTIAPSKTPTKRPTQTKVVYSLPTIELILPTYAMPTLAWPTLDFSARFWASDYMYDDRIVIQVSCTGNCPQEPVISVYESSVDLDYSSSEWVFVRSLKTYGSFYAKNGYSYKIVLENALTSFDTTTLKVQW